MYISVFLHTCKNIHRGTCVREMNVCLGKERKVTMYCRNMSYLVEGLGVTFSLSLLYKYTTFFIMLAYVKRLVLISCAFYFNLVINLYAVFKVTETAGSQTSLSPLSIKMRERQTQT